MPMKRLLLALALALPLLDATALDLPADAQITYDVLYGEGQFKIGRAEQHWHLEGGRYELQTELVPFLGPRIRYLSKGRVGEHGLVPESFGEYRSGDTAPRVRAEFDWDKLLVRYGRADEDRSATLERGAQDVNALAFQLGWLGEQAAGPMQVTTGKKVALYRFSGGARQHVSVNGQRVEALPWRSGSGQERTEVWVAPKWQSVPVRIVRVDDDKQLQFVAREVQIKR
jgi:hypothetical protein